MNEEDLRVLEEYFARLNPHKKGGEDLIPPFLIKSFPHIFVTIFAPIFACCFRLLANR